MADILRDQYVIRGNVIDHNIIQIVRRGAEEQRSREPKAVSLVAHDLRRVLQSARLAAHPWLQLVRRSMQAFSSDRRLHQLYATSCVMAAMA
jgi:hypothetical protein